MDVGGVGNVSAALSQSSSGDAVAILVMKKAMEVQAQSAMQLIAAVPAPAAVNPPGVGANVNTFA